MNGVVTLCQVKIQIENRVINSSKIVARSRENHFLGALITRTPSEEKEEDMRSRLMLSGTTCFCLKCSPCPAASTTSSFPLSLMVMSSGLYCCMFRASLYSSPSFTFSRTVASAVWFGPGAV